MTFLPLICIVLCVDTLGGSLRSISPAARLSEMFSTLPNKTKCYYHGFEEPSLVYYSNKRWENWGDDMDTLNKPDSEILVVLREETRLEDYFAMIYPSFFKPRARNFHTLSAQQESELYAMNYRPFTVSGLNFARCSWVKVEAWCKPKIGKNLGQEKLPSFAKN
jgi:hypothetical protein